jgi:hypothetical protein
VECIQIIQTLFIVVGVIIAVITLLADHKRRKRQATLELYNPISEETYELRNRIRDIFKNEIIDPNDQRYKNDKDLQRTITRFMSLYERISVGINLNVLDLKVFMRIAGKTTIDWYDRLKLLIEHKRSKGHSTAYKDFEILAEKMRKKYGKLYHERYR